MTGREIAKRPQETGTGKIGGRRVGMQATASRRHADIQTGGI